MVRQLLQEHDLAKGPLRVGRAGKRIEDLLERDGVAVAAVDGAPDDAVGLFLILVLFRVFFGELVRGRML